MHLRRFRIITHSRECARESETTRDPSEEVAATTTIWIIVALGMTELVRPSRERDILENVEVISVFNRSRSLWVSMGMDFRTMDLQEDVSERKQPGEDFQAKDGAARIHVLAHANVSLPPTITSLTAVTTAPILAISIIRDAKGRPLQDSK
jgi:hypothetical protein